MGLSWTRLTTNVNHWDSSISILIPTLAQSPHYLVSRFHRSLSWYVHLIDSHTMRYSRYEFIPYPFSHDYSTTSTDKDHYCKSHEIVFNPGCWCKYLSISQSQSSSKKRKKWNTPFISSIPISFLVGGIPTPLKNISQLGSLIPIYLGKL